MAGHQILDQPLAAVAAGAIERVSSVFQGRILSSPFSRAYRGVR
tara:strand:+ start:15432 stop:15563 length:132 start_codon:yes stop_codon:yes gene_type:complete